jgi:alpha-L-fucosidase
MIQKWWADSKFGMFIHWGLFSELAGEYDGVRTFNIAEWIMHDLHIPIRKYEQLAAGFSAERFNADGIVRLAMDTGMKYLVFTSKHHDGFAMYDSAVDNYNIKVRTPFGRDPLMELKEACDRYGIVFGLYYSQAQDWHDKDGCEDGVGSEGKNFERYFYGKCLPQVKELLERYEPQLLWFDTPMYMTLDQSLFLKDFVLSIRPDCMISGRIGNGIGDYATTGDNFIPLLPPGYPFEVPATTNGSWGYNKFDHTWKSPERLLRHLVKIVSRGGNYLLNIGPKANGEVPAECTLILNRIGEFMKKNGESIYGTVPLPVYPYDIDWGYFTFKPNPDGLTGRFYIHVFEKKDFIYLLNIRNKPIKVYLLKDGRPLELKERVTCEGDSSWNIRLPAGDVEDIDTVVCVEVDGCQIEFEPIRR